MSIACRYYDAQHAFRVALCDSFNTPEAINVLRDVVSKVNVYVNSRGSKDTNVELVVLLTQWVSRMLRMFGLGEGGAAEGEIGWGQEVGEGGSGFDVSPRFCYFISAQI